MKRVLSFTSTSEYTICVRHFEVNSGKSINETDVANKSLNFKEIGPRVDL